MSDVDGDDACRAALEQAIGEAARRRAEVGAQGAGNIDPERSERAVEFVTPTGDEAWALTVSAASASSSSPAFSTRRPET